MATCQSFFMVSYWEVLQPFIMHLTHSAVFGRNIPPTPANSNITSKDPMTKAQGKEGGYVYDWLLCSFLPWRWLGRIHRQWQAAKPNTQLISCRVTILCRQFWIWNSELQVILITLAIPSLKTIHLAETKRRAGTMQSIKTPPTKEITELNRFLHFRLLILH